MGGSEVSVRRAGADDAEPIWRIFHAVVEPGDTYAFDPRTSREDALAYWMAADAWTYVAVHAHDVVGTYVLRANQPGQGSHVANAGFMVDPARQRSGIGRRLARHALDEARRLGFAAMQFNFVVATNHGAIALWQELGFSIVGTLPGAFRHPARGLVDAHVMFRRLDDD